MAKETKEKLSNFRIGITQGISGHFAVMLVDVTDDRGTYTDVQQSGIGRYRNKQDAIEEAKEWAKAEELPCIC